MTEAGGNEEEAIFWSALQISAPEERAVFLNDACQGCTSLHEKLDRMLARQIEVDAFFLEAQNTCSKLLSSE
jgi:hypothetical protein